MGQNQRDDWGSHEHETLSPVERLRRYAEEAEREAAAAGATGWLARLGRMLATEHICEPPSADWTAVPSHLASEIPDAHSCPECGQVFVAPEVVPGASSTPA